MTQERPHPGTTLRSRAVTGQAHAARARRQRPRTLVAALAVALAGLLAGCGEEEVPTAAVRTDLDQATSSIVNAIYAYDKAHGYGPPQKIVQHGDTLTSGARVEPNDTGYGDDTAWLGGATLKWYTESSGTYGFCVESGGWHYELGNAQMGGDSRQLTKETAKGPCGPAPRRT